MAKFEAGVLIKVSIDSAQNSVLTFFTPCIYIIFFFTPWIYIIFLHTLYTYYIFSHLVYISIFFHTFFMYYYVVFTPCLPCISNPKPGKTYEPWSINWENYCKNPLPGPAHVYLVVYKSYPYSVLTWYYGQTSETGHLQIAVTSKKQPLANNDQNMHDGDVVQQWHSAHNTSMTISSNTFSWFDWLRKYANIVVSDPT